MWIIGKADFPASNVKELIAWLKANPDKATMAAVGWGGASHLCGVYFQKETGTRLTFVPYRGAAPANQDLVAGQIDLFCPEASNSLPLVQSGKVKAFAVLAKTRWAAAPDVPTIDEAGLPGLYIPFWHGFFVARRHAHGRTSASSMPRRWRRLADPADAHAADRDGPGDSVRATCRRRRRSPPSRRPRSRSGGRSSRRPASRRSDSDEAGAEPRMTQGEKA